MVGWIIEKSSGMEIHAAGYRGEHIHSTKTVIREISDTVHVSNNENITETGANNFIPTNMRPIAWKLWLKPLKTDKVWRNRANNVF
jgi:nitrate/TMAO reductase-like tetraheme cytochrome c subunit